MTIWASDVIIQAYTNKEQSMTGLEIIVTAVVVAVVFAVKVWILTKI